MPIPDWAKNASSVQPVVQDNTQSTDAPVWAQSSSADSKSGVSYTKSFAKAPWFDDYKKLKDTDASAPLDSLSDNADERDKQIALQAKSYFDNKGKQGTLADDYNTSIKNQGGPGLSPETYDALGGNSTTPILSSLQRPLAAAADLAVRAYKGTNAGIEAGALGLDRLVDSTGLSGLSQQYLGNKFQPGHGLMAMMEAFPGAGAEIGLPGGAMKAPEGDMLAVAERDRLNNEAADLFKKGYSKDQLNQWAADNHLDSFKDDLDVAIKARDNANKINAPTAEEATPASTETAPASTETPAASLSTDTVAPATVTEPPTPADTAATAEVAKPAAPEADPVIDAKQQAIVDTTKTAREAVDSDSPVARQAVEAQSQALADKPRPQTLEDWQAELAPDKAVTQTGTSFYREASPERAVESFPTTENQPQGLGGDSTYLADHPDLAKGQGKNTGVLMEFDKDSLKATPKIKPGQSPDLASEAGQEYIGNNKPEDYSNALKKVTVSADRYKEALETSAKYDYAGRGISSGFLRDLEDLEKSGWTKETKPNGDVVYNKPAPTEPTNTAAPASGEAPTPPPEAVPAPIDDIISRLTDALSGAKKLLPEQAELYSQARKEKLAAASQAMKVGGVQGFRSAMSELKGALPSVDFNPVGAKFSEADADALYTHLANSPKLQGYESIQAMTGLDKLMKGKLPAPNEITKLSQAFPPDFIKAVMSNRSKKETMMDMFSQAYNLPRSLVSTLDASIPLRQGVFMVSRPEFYNAFGTMVKQMASEKYFEATQQGIRDRPSFELMENSGLSIHDKFTNRPEQFRSSWAEQIPVFKHIYKVSERGAEAFSNQLRADTFDRFISQYKDAGIDLSSNPVLAKRVANYVNSATGRGSVPFDKVGRLAGDIFFSPQLMASRMYLLNPATYLLEKDPILRANKLRDLAGFGAIAGTALSLASLAGGNVGTNPLSADWGKIRIKAQGGAVGAASTIPGIFGMGLQTYNGETRYDIFGGMQQYAHLAAVLAAGKKTSIKGKTTTLGEGYNAQTRVDVLGHFLRSKESPAASIVHDYLAGTDYIGNKFNLQNELIQRMIPFSAQDTFEGYYPNTNNIGSSSTKSSSTPTPAAPTANNGGGNTDIPDWAKQK